MASTEHAIRDRMEFPVPPVLMKERSRSTSRPCFGQYLLSYDRGRGSDTADSNTFPFKVLQALQLRLAKNPTEDFIVCGKDDLKGRPSLSNAYKPHGPRHTKLKATRNHGLDTQF